ncbi:hypothetical protein BMS3Abin04_01390 [bacterium BMS3Abin04]|nr:hypothetical protein BMS3Abin04_01390 [bacterium BMS3Abin04]
MDSIRSTGIKSLYKFKTFDKKNHYQDLLNNVLYFPSPRELNDPFDSKIPIRYDLCTKQELVEIVKKFETVKYDKSPRKERRKTVFQKVKELQQELKSNPERIVKRMEKYIENTIGIFSFTEKLDNLLLWSHYADSHKGFCVEFSAPKLNNLMVEVFLKEIDKAFIFKVHYQNEYPIVHPIKTSYEDRLNLQFCTKSKNWEYEKEWRIIFMNYKKKAEIPSNIISNIYLGLLADESNITTSIAILKKSNPNIGLYKAVKKKNAFGLHFEKLIL